MDHHTTQDQFLNFFSHPVVIVNDGIITKMNTSAEQLFLSTGTKIETLIENGQSEYAKLHKGVLYITLSIQNHSWGAAVSRSKDGDIIVLDAPYENGQLQALALAAKELRGPLSSMMLAVQQFAASQQGNASEVSQLNRGLYQMLRIVSNMSDASGAGQVPHCEAREANAFFREIAEKAAVLFEKSGIKIEYSGLSKDVLCMVDSQQLERAALNMIANAVKFSGKGKKILLELSQTGSALRFSVSDQGEGIPESISPTLFTRYLREPGIENSRYGVGLGMLLIRNAARLHEGTVLIDHPDGWGTRVSLTISQNRKSNGTLRSPKLWPDYTGNQDHMLIEFSEFLPPELYET